MLSRLWNFLRDEGNRGVLAFLGGGAAIVIGGIWTATIHFVEPKGGGKPEPAPDALVLLGDAQKLLLHVGALGDMV